MTRIETIEQVAYIFAVKAYADIPNEAQVAERLIWLKNRFDNPTHVLFLGNEEGYELYYFKSEEEANRYLKMKAFW